MPYIKRTTRAGRTIEVEYYYSSVYNKRGGSRKDKVKPTREEQIRVNNRAAERKLRLLIANNYGYGDYHLVLDYIRRKGEPERTREQMQHDIQVFLRELRKEYRKAGLELKYIHVMEIGRKGARHHHLVVNHIDVRVLQQAWYKAYEGHNRVKVFPLDDTGNYADLASYLIKYTTEHLRDAERMQGKRWNASKNLTQPVTVREIVTSRSWFRREAKPLKGYYIDASSVASGITSPEYYGYGWFRYRMVRC